MCMCVCVSDFTDNARFVVSWRVRRRQPKAQVLYYANYPRIIRFNTAVNTFAVLDGERPVISHALNM